VDDGLRSEIGDDEMPTGQ